MGSKVVMGGVKTQAHWGFVLLERDYDRHPSIHSCLSILSTHEVFQTGSRRDLATTPNSRSSLGGYLTRFCVRVTKVRRPHCNHGGGGPAL